MAICCNPCLCIAPQKAAILVAIPDAKNTWVSIIWSFGTVACWLTYYVLYGIEFLTTTKKQHMFTSYTIWKFVEYNIFFYFSFVAETFRIRLLEERQQKTLETSRAAEVQAGAPAQDQPCDQSINAENHIMNP